MILDHSILQLLSVVDKDLETFTQKITFGAVEISIKKQNEEQYSKIEYLQNSLQHVKTIVNNFQKNIVNQSNINQVQKINFNSLQQFTNQFTYSYNDMKAIQIQSVEDSQIEISQIEKFLNYTIYRYILILCYYTITVETLNNLPKALETESYFRSIEGSFINKLYYMLQTSIGRSIELFYIIKQKMNHFLKISSTKFHRDNLSDLFYKEIPAFANSFCHNELLPTLTKINRVQSFDFIGIATTRNKITNPVSFILGLPSYMLNNELQRKVTFINSMNNKSLSKFGNLIESFPRKFLNGNAIECFNLLHMFLNDQNRIDDTSIDIIKETQSFVKEQNSIKLVSEEKPSYLVRYWPIGLLAVMNGPKLIMLTWQSRYQIITFFQRNVLDFIRGLFYNWIWIPIKDIWATVRHDDGSEIAMMSNGTLDSEMNSLCRMVIKIVKDNNPKYVETIGENVLIDQIIHGDLDEFMKIYENELNNPIRNIFTGKLIRSILIQVQKTKVDGSLALNGIDKMLKSQQLVFGIMALSPATFVIYLTMNSLTRLIKLGNIWSNVSHYKKQVSKSLNNIERLLNYENFEKEAENNDDLENINHALLIMEISDLSVNGSLIVPKDRKDEWVRDIGDLVNTGLSNKAKLNVVNRIYHAYSRYFIS